MSPRPRASSADRDAATEARAAEAAADSPADSASTAVDPLHNVAILVAYRGSGLQGWQVQPHGPSVQGRIEDALRVICRQEVKVYGSGRTDAGVHALGQVANLCVSPRRDLQRLQASLNGLLAPDISVRATVPVPADFHARHRAQGKVYRYRLFNRRYPPVFGRDRVWWVKQPLDAEAMRAAAPHLLGEHDFSAFRSAQCEAAHPVRTLRRLEVQPGGGADCTLAIELEANGFLQHMARIISGTLVAVGQGKLAPAQVAALLAGRRRQDAPATAPPGGLHLVRVCYDLTRYPTLRAFLEA